MASVGLNERFTVAGSGSYVPVAAGVASGEAGSPPPLPIPLGWAPDPTLELDTAANELRLAFTEPASWTRGPWHLPATPDGFYVPSHLYPSDRAWIGQGPSLWGYSIDGGFRQAGISPGGPGARTTISFLPDTPNAATGQPLDWSQPHTFRLHLLYQDVPDYQWWGWDGTFGLAPKGTFVSPWWFFPQDRFRATQFPDGYPANEPIQPVLPAGLTSLDYGGLGPAEVGHQVLEEGGRFASLLAFPHHRENAVYLEVVSDPYTLQLPAAPAPAPAPAAFSAVRIEGVPAVGQTLTAVLS